MRTPCDSLLSTGCDHILVVFGGASMSAIAEQVVDDDAILQITDTSTVPDEPPPELVYSHRPRLLASAREAWRHRDVMYTIAERDIRVSYKQQVLGFGWAVLTPLMTLVIFTILLHNDRSVQFAIPGTHKVVPYMLVTYVGMWAWGLFGGALVGGAGSLIGNKLLMAKTHFPRECFPISQILESAFTTVLALVPMVVLFLVYHYTPRVETVWALLYLLVEIPFIVGVILLASAVLVQARDLLQVLPIFTQFGMLATPVVWQFSKLRHTHIPGIPGVHNFQPIYSLLNPLGPVISGLKDSILLGQGPQWGVLGIAMIGSLLYFGVGYTVFKRLEVNFADLC